MSPRKENPRLTARRACIKGTDQIPPHDVSRHKDFGDAELKHPDLPDSFDFAQGTLFPSCVRPGDIKEISRQVEREYHKYKKGRQNDLTGIQPAGGADRIRVKIKRYGVKEVGAFIRGGEAVTVFPDED